MNRKQIIENKIFNLEFMIKSYPTHKDVEYMKAKIKKLKELLETPRNESLDIGVKGNKVKLFVKQFEFTPKKRRVNDDR